MVRWLTASVTPSCTLFPHPSTFEYSAGIRPWPVARRTPTTLLREESQDLHALRGWWVGLYCFADLHSLTLLRSPPLRRAPARVQPDIVYRVQVPAELRRDCAGSGCTAVVVASTRRLAAVRRLQIGIRQSQRILADFPDEEQGEDLAQDSYLDVFLCEPDIVLLS